MSEVRIDADTPEFTITRIFDAPRPLVYRIWTDPAYVAQWWGINGATNPVCEIDARPGGSMRIVMQTADGDRYENRGVYLDVVENERIIFRDVRDDVTGPWKPPIGVHTVTFEDAGMKTRVTLTARFTTSEDRDAVVAAGVTNGIQQSLDRFERVLSQALTQSGDA